MSTDACLVLYLDAPLQSWGFTSRFTRRTTRLHPTRSGIIGLVAAAWGIDKFASDEAGQLARLTALRCVTITLPKQRGERTLPVLRLNDYHTIGGGYDRETEAMKKPRAASGATLETVLSERHYLLDARFGVLLEGERSLLDELAGALHNPRWGLWFGRKCCLPASPVLVGVETGRPEGLRALLVRAGYPPDLPLTSFDHLVEGQEAEGLDAEWLTDTPVAFGAPIGERHVPRRIRHIRAKS